MQRVCLLHTYGPLEGIVQILGLWPNQPVPALLSDSWGQASLVRAEPRYILYRSASLGAPSPEGPGAQSGVPA